MDTVKIFKDMVNSKEYSHAMMCAKKNCHDYKIILDKEKELTKKIDKLKKSMSSAKDIKQILIKSIEIIDYTIEMLELRTNKKSLKCFLENCMSEHIDIITVTNKKMIGMLQKQKKDGKDVIKRFEKQDKKKK